MATNDNFQSETMDFTVHGNNWLSTNTDTFKMPTEEPHYNKKPKKKIKLAVVNCLKCSGLIKEKHLYAISENYWHKCCVRCDNCEVQLDESGFLIDNTLFCRTCYNQSIHVTKCFGCKLPIQTQEVVMYALNQPYHLLCFKCHYCKNPLSKGDKFVFQNGILICKEDFEAGTCMSSQPSNSTKQQIYKIDNPHENNGIRRKTKILSPQRQYLENYYIRNSNPSIKQRAYIAEELNLPVKVVQTWFCNYRTKMKMQRNNDIKLFNDKLQASDHDRRGVDKVKQMLDMQHHQQMCYTPDIDCSTNCQISQSTDDHASPQDLSSDLSGMYTCPEMVAKSYVLRMNGLGGGGCGGGAGSGSGGCPLSDNSDSNTNTNHPNESIDDRGLTYADLTNSCVKSIDRAIMDRFSVDSQTKAACLTWS